MESNEYILIKQQLEGMTTLVNAQFKGTHERLDKINGRVGKTEDKIYDLEIKSIRFSEEYKNSNLNRESNCPIAPKVRVLEDNQLTQKAIKKWLFVAVGLTATIIGLAFTFIKLFILI